MDTRHFLISERGEIQEYNNDTAQAIALGNNVLPEFAGSWVRYLQVQLEKQAEDELRVTTAAASIQFDDEGRLLQADAPAEHGQNFTEFEHETCIQLALEHNFPHAQLNH